MKKIIIALLLLANVAYSQKGTEKVWDLLLQNKRTEARALFDKNFGKVKDQNVDLLLLDAFIEQERGKMIFDTQFIEKFLKFPESKYLLYPIWYNNFAVGDVESEGFYDYTFDRMDLITKSNFVEKDIFVQYFKAVFDRRRKRYDDYNKGIAKLSEINKWQFCGVFENINDSGLDIDYGPENYANNDKTFNANSNGIVNWYNPEIPQNEGCHFYLNETEYISGIIYAQTFIDNPVEREVVLHFGSESPMKIYLNDSEIYVNRKIKASDLNAYELQFTLPKGTNRLLLKSSLKTYKDYFFAALRDVQGNIINDISYSDVYKDYNKSTLSQISPVERSPYFESYLEEKVAKEPSNILYSLLLFDAYINNYKSEKAFTAIKALANKYPLSSMVNYRLIKYYNSIENYDKVTELQQNTLNNDKYYYYSIDLKCSDNDFLKSSNITELEEYRDKAKKLLNRHYELLLDIMIALRNSNIDLAFEKTEEFLVESRHNDANVLSFSSFYATLKNDRQKTISILEGLVEKYDNMEAESALIKYYNAANRKADVKAIIDSRISRYPYLNMVYTDAIALANNDNNYEQAVKYADIALNNFPYSYSILEKKGRSYSAMNNTKEAEKYFKQSLQHNSGNYTLRQTLYDIKKIPDEIETVATKDVYALIKETRNLKEKMYCDYGVNLLLDECIINVFPEGGQKSKTTIVYEVIAENGIDELKEYDISGNGINVLKSEIVKPDGTLVPGDRSNGSVVFTNLKVGDVVFIQYETNYSGTGRFYKDFNFNYYLNGSYPSLKNHFGIIYPDGVTFKYNITNGNLKPVSKKVNGSNFMIWEQRNVPALVLHEGFTKEYSDLVMKINISSIQSWADIANWYADLVQKNMKLENEALTAYNTIFPDGTAALSENEKAFKIYKYIEENITYSSVDFRQSGYVPQTPAKTVSSRLGDCKDLSTLFVAMAEKAGLKANLVLVQTSDNGTDWLKLPSLNFNHCIVRVNIDGKQEFLEMTDRYLPFKSLNEALYNANALVVDFDKEVNKNVQLSKVVSVEGFINKIYTKSIIDVAQASKQFKVTHSVNGGFKSYYNELFGEGVTEDLRKKEVEENFNDWLAKVTTLNNVKLIKNERFDKEIVYEADFSVNENLQSVGSLSIMEIPYIFKAYTKDIISKATREYDIYYPSYEKINNYISEYIINIPEGKSFTEVPKSREFAYKEHRYKLSFNLQAPNSLKVVREAYVPWDDITTVDYPGYKKFVEEIIAAEEEIVGFK